ncbi:MAG: helicase [Sphingomonadales bacterium]|nr:MAG: helicase [Sphingomonadales bacterium]
MAEEDVRQALRTDARLVVVEAPAGCGKTYQAAAYAQWWAEHREGRTLILTHTHAACDVFREQTSAIRTRTHVTTIDGFVTQIASCYHETLGLPPDVARWAHDAGEDGFEQVAYHVERLLLGSSAFRAAVIARYPNIVCDEHQDTNAAQHQIVMLLIEAGAKVRVFGDPSQAIYAKRVPARAAHRQRWQTLVERADHVEDLDFPHRWRRGSMALGEWALLARRALADGSPVDLRGARPEGLTVIEADNVGHHAQFRLNREGSRVWRAVDTDQTLMVLSPTSALVAGINGYLRRTLPIWEGHRRSSLDALVRACEASSGNAAALAVAVRAFIEGTVTGFTSSIAQRFEHEVATSAGGRCRGMPLELQTMARLLLDYPDHRGVSRSIRHLKEALGHCDAMSDIKINMQREFNEACRLDEFEGAAAGHAELTRRRTMAKTFMPRRLISTVHKAKGLEVANVLLMPCDATTFAGSEYKRCLLYVALTRATNSLTLVVSRERPSPLFLL